MATRLLLVFLLAFGLAVAGDAETQQGKPRPRPKVMQKPVSQALRPGETTVVEWQIDGTTEPVPVRLRNTNKASGTMEGGDDQVVVSSGGTPNLVRRVVKARAPGVFQIEAEVESDGDATAEEIEAAFRRELRRIAEDTRRAQRRVPRWRQARFVLQVIDHVEADVARSLPYRELAPFRDALAAFLAELRAEIAAHSRASLNEIVLVADRTDEASWLDRLADWLEDASDKSTIGTLCIRTTPVSQASLKFYPKSFPSDVTEATSTSLLTLYLGRYVYEIERGGYLPSKSEIDLLLGAERIVTCVLRTRDSDPQACQLSNGPEEPCR